MSGRWDLGVWDPLADAAGWYDQDRVDTVDRELVLQERQIRYEADVRAGFPLGRYRAPGSLR